MKSSVSMVTTLTHNEEQIEKELQSNEFSSGGVNQTWLFDHRRSDPQVAPFLDIEILVTPRTNDQDEFKCNVSCLSLHPQDFFTRRLISQHFTTSCHRTGRASMCSFQYFAIGELPSGTLV
jgi:hypothetical protein